MRNQVVKVKRRISGDVKSGDAASHQDLAQHSLGLRQTHSNHNQAHSQNQTE